MNTNRLATFLAAGFALILPLQSSAQPAHPAGLGMMPPHVGAPMPDMPGKHMPLPPFLQGIELSETQQDELFKIMHAAAPALRQQEKILHQIRDELRGLAQTAPDEAKLKSVLDRLAKATAEAELQRFRIGQKIFAILTPEQIQRANARGGKDKPGR